MQWLAFNDEDGLFAYDSSNFPSLTFADGQYIFVLVNDDLRVLKLDGNEASSPISLKGESDITPSAAWQPAP